LDWNGKTFQAADFKPSAPELYQPLIQENNFLGSLHPTQVVIPIKASMLAVDIG